MELLTVSNVAARLHCSEGTVRRWANSGRLRIFVRLADGSRLFRERDVLAVAVAAHTVGGARLIHPDEIVRVLRVRKAKGSIVNCKSGSNEQGGWHRA